MGYQVRQVASKSTNNIRNAGVHRGMSEYGAGSDLQIHSSLLILPQFFKGLWGSSGPQGQ